MPSVSRRSRTVGPTPFTASSTARSSALNRAGEGAVIAPPSATAPVRDAAWRSIALVWRSLLRAESPAADHLSRPESHAAAPLAPGRAAGRVGGEEGPLRVN